MVYTFYKVGQFLFKMFFIGAAQHSRQTFQGQQRRNHQQRPTDGNVNIDYVPNPNTKKGDGHLKGGDYVDFEEVK